MRNKYWAMYCRLIYSKYYYWHYRNRATFWDIAINILLCITSVGGIASWMIWRQFPWIWAIIIGTSQIANAIHGLLPFKKQIKAVTSLTPELDHLINAADRDWNLIKLGMSDFEITQLLYEYNERFTSIESKYTNDIFFPENKRLLKKASKQRGDHLSQNLDIEETELLHKGDVNNGKQSASEREPTAQSKSDTRKAPIA